MSLFENLALGFSIALSLKSLGYCLMGVTLGTLVGVLPGLGTLAAIAMLLPLTFQLDPGTALIMLAGIYYGVAYGGSTASILLNLPGTPNTAVTALDGHPMTKNGRAGVARTEVDGVTSLKVTLLDPTATLDDVAATLDVLRDCGESLVAERGAVA